MSSLPKASILLVDDDPSNLLVLETTLARLGENLVSAGSGQEALKHLLSQQFAVILLDVQMDGMDGYQTARLIRERDQSKHTPIIFVTGSDPSEAHVLRGYELGAVDYMFKPIVPEILCSKTEVFVQLFRQTKELLGSQKRLKAIVDTAHDAIITADMNRIIHSFNPAAEDIFGWTESEAIGQPLGILHADKDEASKFQSFREQWQDSGNATLFKKRFELAGVRKNGKNFPMTLAIALTDVEGDTLLTGIFRDVTEEKIAQQAIIAAKDQAEQTTRVKSEFLANMSHELRTPLNAIIGFSQIMKNTMLGPIGNVKYRDYANDIFDSGTHLLGIINDILDISKIESGKIELYEEHVDVLVIILSAKNLLKEHAEDSGVGFQLDIAEDLPLLLADERSVKQVLLNLLSNAVKFTPAGGVITIRVWCNFDDGYIIQVIDTGIGIAPSDIPKALAPFGQIDSGLERKFQGTGLGLPLTKSLIELHGGSLDIQSEVGVGTTITVRFPAVRIVDISVNARLKDDGNRAAN